MMNENRYNTARILVLSTEKGRPLVRLSGQLELSDEAYDACLDPRFPIRDLGHAAYFCGLMGGEPYGYWLGAGHG